MPRPVLVLGLIYFTDVNFAGGGIKVKSGSSGTQLYVKNAIEEGDFSHAIPPVVWFTGWNSANSDAVLDNIQNADGGSGSMPAIETDVSGGIYGTVEGPTVLNGGLPSGPATDFNPLGTVYIRLLRLTHLSKVNLVFTMATSWGERM